MSDCKYPVFKELMNNIFRWLHNPDQKVIVDYCNFNPTDNNDFKLAESTISHYLSGKSIPNLDNVKVLSEGIEKYLKSKDNKTDITIDKFKNKVLNFANEQDIDIEASNKLECIMMDIVSGIKRPKFKPTPEPKGPKEKENQSEYTQLKQSIIEVSKDYYSELGKTGARFQSINISDISEA
ncbi:MAG TPA: hypothetical protein VF941_11385, partial [Clostridia bacterium]